MAAYVTSVATSWVIVLVISVMFASISHSGNTVQFEEETCRDIRNKGLYPIGTRYVVVEENMCNVYRCVGHDKIEFEDKMCLSVFPDDCIYPGSPQVFPCKDERGRRHPECRCIWFRNHTVTQVIGMVYPDDDDLQ